MKELLGTWRGTGRAVYPTIDSARYREETIFNEHAGDPITQYEQKTWRIHADNSETLLHWEFGFIRQMEDGSYEWSNTQNNGRVEVLKGTISASFGLLSLDFQSVAFANDPRMMQSARQVTIEGDLLRYRMTMATQTNPDNELHLEAELSRA